MLGRERQIVDWVKEHVYGVRQRAASAVAQRNDQFEAAAQVLNRIFQASKNFAAQAVTRNADHKKIVRSLIENEFYRNAGIRAAQNSREGSLLWHRTVPAAKPKSRRSTGMICCIPPVFSSWSRSLAKLLLPCSNLSKAALLSAGNGLIAVSSSQ